MKRIAFWMVVLLLTTAGVAAAEYGEWEQQYLIPGNYNNVFLDVSALDPNNAFMVGIWTDSISTFKFVWRTTNGGDFVENVYSWSMNPELMCEMLKISDARTTTAYVKENFALFGGSGVSQDCIDGYGPDIGQQMICLIACAMTIGPSIWYTDDNGETFHDAALPAGPTDGSGSVQSISMVDDTIGFAAGLGSYIVKTTDGGLTWAKTGALTKPDEWINRIYCHDENTCWVAAGEWDPDPESKAGLQGVAKVKNHFHNMMLSSNPAYRRSYWASLDPSKATKMVNGAVYKTVDGGDTWVQQKVSSSEGYDAIHFVDANNGWMIGEEFVSFEQGDILRIYRTTDGGDTWDDVTANFPATISGLQGYAISGVKFANPGFGIAYGYGQKGFNYVPVFLYSQDGGDTWTPDTTTFGLQGGQFAMTWVTPTMAFSVGFYLNLMSYAGENLNPPIADAGEDFSAEVGKEANLDGSGSYDPDGGGVFYAWTQVSGPTVTLSDATVAQPTFTPAETGEAVFQLIVSDGEFDSEPDTVTVTFVPATDDDSADDDATDDDATDDDAADDDATDDDDNQGDDDDDDDGGCGC